MLAPINDGEESSHADFQHLALDSFDLWRRLSADAPWQDGVRFEGAALIAADANAFIAKTKNLARAAEPLSASQWRKRTGFEARVEHAVYVADEGVADPTRVLSGLLMEVRRYGGEVRYGVDVVSTTATSVTTERDETIEADHVLLTPGVWATEALQTFAPALKHVRPAKGQLVPVTLAQPLGLTVRAHDFYLTPRLSDVVLGASFELDRFDRGADPARAAELVAAADRVLPGEVEASGRGWAGIRPMSPDGAPIIGRSGDVLVACGHSRNGWLLAPVTAEIVCALILGEDLPAHWQAFGPERFA